MDLLIDDVKNQSKTTNTNGLAVFTFNSDSLNVGEHRVRVRVTNIQSITSQPWVLTINAGTANYDRLTMSVDSATHAPGEIFLFTPQLKMGTANASVPNVLVNLGIDGFLAGSGLTTAGGFVRISVPASSLTVGTHNAVAYLDAQPGIFTQTKAISVTGASTVGTVNFAITNPSVNDAATPFQFTGDVRDIAGLPMSGVTVALGSKSALSSVFLFNQTWAVTNTTGQFGGTQLSTEGTFDFKAVANSVESAVVSGTRTIPPQGEAVMTIIRKADGSAVTDGNPNIQLNSVIRITIAFFTPSQITGIQLWYIPATGPQVDLGRIPTDSFGSGSIEVAMTNLGNASIGVVDLTLPGNNKVLNINVIEGGPPPPPPPPPGSGIGKTWGQMTFTEKILAVGVGALALPTVMQLSGIYMPKTYTAPKKIKKVHKGRINTKELARYLRRTLK